MNREKGPAQRKPEHLAHPTIAETNGLVAETIEHHASLLPSLEADTSEEARRRMLQYSKALHAVQQALSARGNVIDPDFGDPNSSRLIEGAARILQEHGFSNGHSRRLAAHLAHLKALNEELGARQRQLLNLETRLRAREMIKIGE